MLAGFSQDPKGVLKKMKPERLQMGAEVHRIVKHMIISHACDSFPAALRGVIIIIIDYCS